MLYYRPILKDKNSNQVLPLSQLFDSRKAVLAWYKAEVELHEHITVVNGNKECPYPSLFGVEKVQIFRFPKG